MDESVQTYEIVNSLNDSACGIVSPIGTRINRRNPSSESTRIRATSHDPGSVLSIAASVGVEGQLDVIGEISCVLDRVLQGEVSQILGCQHRVRARVTPVSMFHQNRGAANSLRKESGDRLVREITCIARGSDFTRCEEDHRSARAGPVLGAPPVSLAERALAGV